MRRFLLPLIFFAACSRVEPHGGEAPPPEATAPGPVGEAASPAVVAAPGDAPLPDADEVPSFLTGASRSQEGTGSAFAGEAPDLEVSIEVGDAPPREPTLAELMRGVDADEAPSDDLAALLRGVEVDEAPRGDLAALLRGVEVEGQPAAPTRDAGLAELMRSVRVGDTDEGGSWAFIGGAVPLAPAVPEEEPVPEAEPGPEQAPVVAAAPAPAPEEDEDRCAPLRRLVDKRQTWLRRTAAERDQYGWIESKEDVQALRLLTGLRRCVEHPDDPDCRPRPIEVDVNDLVVPSHQIERSPSDLNAEGKLPDEIPHDPAVLDLLHQLARCEREAIAQPLLER